MWKIMLAIAGLLLLATAAFADVTTRTEIHCEGNCSVRQTVNNKTFELSSNESLDAEINASAGAQIGNDGVVVDISASGTGNAIAGSLDNTGEYQVNATIDGQERTEHGFGVFEFVFSFLKSISLFGWFR